MSIHELDLCKPGIRNPKIPSPFNYDSAEFFMITVIDVLRTYMRNTQITPFDSRAAQKQSNKQIKRQYMHVSRDPDELQPLVQGLVKVVGRGFISQRDGRANCVKHVSRHSGNIVSKQSRFIASQCVCVYPSDRETSLK
jgi:hypothetical protein